MQSQLAQMEEQKYNITANNKVKLVISDKEFITNSNTLSDQTHGNTLFNQSLSQINQTMDNQDNKTNPIIELYFDRNPDLFIFILDYLRGYQLKSKLHQLQISELEKLRDDAIYFKMNGFQQLIASILHTRINPQITHPLIKLTHNSTIAKRCNENNNQWTSTAVYGTVSDTGSRYVEIIIATNLNKNILLGVTEADPVRIASYVGAATFPGCGYECSTGYIYNKGANQAWGAKIGFGDRLGAFVKVNKESNMATIAFYKNGGLLNKEMNLKNYTDVDKGVVFVVSLYDGLDQVQIVQDCRPPQ